MQGEVQIKRNHLEIPEMRGQVVRPLTELKSDNLMHDCSITCLFFLFNKYQVVNRVPLRYARTDKSRANHPTRLVPFGSGSPPRDVGPRDLTLILFREGATVSTATVT